jgi:AcrR family transcriptional regulator
VPKLWNDTIEAHRREVRDAILDTTAALVAEQGLRAVTMSQIAEKTGIGRATLYKYFSEVEAILAEWHQRQIGAHLEQLFKLNEQPRPPLERLEAVLETYAFIQHEHQGHALASLLHSGEHVAHARQHLMGFLRELLLECVEANQVRDDVPPQELASYCVHALGGATSAISKAAVRRLVGLTMDGLTTLA